MKVNSQSFLWFVIVVLLVVLLFIFLNSGGSDSNTSASAQTLPESDAVQSNISTTDLGKDNRTNREVLQRSLAQLQEKQSRETTTSNSQIKSFHVNVSDTLLICDYKSELELLLNSIFSDNPRTDLDCWFLEIGDRVVPLDDSQVGIDIANKGTQIAIRVHVENPEYVDIGWTLRDPLIMNSTIR